MHSAPGRPQGRGKIERFFRTVREQFLVEVTDTTAEDLAAAGVDHRGALSELNRLFMAWVETEYHRRTHSETGQSPLARWEAGWDRLSGLPALPTAADLTEAFLWSEFRVVTKTATVSLHSNTYRVDPALTGRRVELVFSPFDLQTIEVRYREKSFGAAVAHTITRHTHPKARPETPSSPPPAATGIDYLALTAAAHHEQLRHDERIGYHALYGPSTDPTPRWAAMARFRVSCRSLTSTPTTLLMKMGCRHEYRTAAVALGFQSDAIRTEPGPVDAAPPPRPQ